LIEFDFVYFCLRGSSFLFPCLPFLPDQVPKVPVRVVVVGDGFGFGDEALQGVLAVGAQGSLAPEPGAEGFGG